MSDSDWANARAKEYLMDQFSMWQAEQREALIEVLREVYQEGRRDGWKAFPEAMSRAADAEAQRWEADNGTARPDYEPICVGCGCRMISDDTYCAICLGEIERME